MTLGAGIGGIVLYDHYLHSRFYGTWTGPYEIFKVTFNEDKNLQWTLLDYPLLDGTWKVIDGQHVRFDVTIDDQKKYIYWLYVIEQLEDGKYLLLTCGENNMGIPEGYKIDLLYQTE